MRVFLITVSALVVIGFSGQAEAQLQQIKPAHGRFYCQGVFNFDLRMDVDFFGNSARLEFYNARTGEYTLRQGSFDDFRSNIMTTRYDVYPLASIDFPSDYQLKHWFRVTYSDSYGWIGFDCNHF